LSGSEKFGGKSYAISGKIRKFVYTKFTCAYSITRYFSRRKNKENDERKGERAREREREREKERE